jgi:CheY-like chemotaxis protein
MRRLLELLLRREGYPVESRASGAAALQALRRASPGHRSVVLYEATTRWALVHDAPRFFAVVARHTALHQHAFVLLTAEVEVLPNDLQDVLAPLAECVRPIAFELQTLLDAVAAACTAAPIGPRERAGVQPIRARSL